MSSSETPVNRKYSQNGVEWMNLDLSGGKMGKVNVDLTKIHTARHLRALKVLKHDETLEFVESMYDNSLHEYSIFRGLENVMNTRIIMAQQDQAHIYMVMEFPLCDNLYMVMRRMRCHRMAEPRAVKYVLQLASAVHYLHRRDIKCRVSVMPENVVLTAWDDVKLHDYGYTPMRGSAKRPGTAIDYRAPEVLQRIPSEEPRYVWALGVLLYEMITSITPYQKCLMAGRVIRSSNKQVDYPEFLTPDTTEMLQQMLSLIETERIDLMSVLSTSWMWSVTNERNRMLAGIYSGLRFIEPTLPCPERVTPDKPTHPTLRGSLFEVRKSFERIGDEPLDTESLSLDQMLNAYMHCPIIMRHMSIYARIRMKTTHHSNVPLSYPLTLATDRKNLDFQCVEDYEDELFAEDECDENLALEDPDSEPIVAEDPVENPTEPEDN